MRINTLSKGTFLPEKTLPVSVIRRDPQTDYMMHSHDFSELVIVYRGTAEQIIFGEKRAIAKGDVFLIDGKIRHGYQKTKDLALYNVIFDLHDFTNPLPAFSPGPSLGTLFHLQVGVQEKQFRKLQNKDLEKILKILREMEKEQESGLEGSGMALSALFVLLAVRLGRIFKKESEPVSMRHAELFIRLFNRIAEEPSGDLSREAMAEEAGMSFSTLTRHFRKLTGYAPAEYVQHVRLKKGAMLLLNGELSISEIAERSGFRDSNYFCRQFRKYFGTSPSRYRKTVG